MVETAFRLPVKKLRVDVLAIDRFDQLDVEVAEKSECEILTTFHRNAIQGLAMDWRIVEAGEPPRAHRQHEGFSRARTRKNISELERRPRENIV